MLSYTYCPASCGNISIDIAKNLDNPISGVINNISRCRAIEEIDEKAENYAERINRKKFYEKNGFHDLNCKLREASVVYDLLGLGDKIKPKDYADMFDEYLGKMFRRFVKMEILD